MKFIIAFLIGQNPLFGKEEIRYCLSRAIQLSRAFPGIRETSAVTDSHEALEFLKEYGIPVLSGEQDLRFLAVPPLLDKPENYMPVIRLDARNPLLQRKTLERALRQYHEERGKTVCSFRKPPDHPCQFQKSLNLIKAGILYRFEQPLEAQKIYKQWACEKGVWPVDHTGTFLLSMPVFFDWESHAFPFWGPFSQQQAASINSVRRERFYLQTENAFWLQVGDKTARLLLPEERLPAPGSDLIGSALPLPGEKPLVTIHGDQAKPVIKIHAAIENLYLNFWPFNPNGWISPEPAGICFHASVQEKAILMAPQTTGFVFSLAAVGQSAAVDVLYPFETGGLLWSRTTNLINGEKIHGRQAFPEVLEMDGSLMIIPSEQAGTDIQDLLAENRIIPFVLEEHEGPAMQNLLDRLKFKVLNAHDENFPAVFSDHASAGLLAHTTGDSNASKLLISMDSKQPNEPGTPWPHLTALCDLQHAKSLLNNLPLALEDSSAALAHIYEKMNLAARPFTSRFFNRAIFSRRSQDRANNEPDRMIRGQKITAPSIDSLGQIVSPMRLEDGRIIFSLEERSGVFYLTQDHCLYEAKGLEALQLARLVPWENGLVGLETKGTNLIFMDQDLNYSRQIPFAGSSAEPDYYDLQAVGPLIYIAAVRRKIIWAVDRNGQIRFQGCFPQMDYMMSMTDFDNQLLFINTPACSDGSGEIMRLNPAGKLDSLFSLLWAPLALATSNRRLFCSDRFGLYILHAHDHGIEPLLFVPYDRLYHSANPAETACIYALSACTTGLYAFFVIQGNLSSLDQRTEIVRYAYHNLLPENKPSIVNGINNE